MKSIYAVATAAMVAGAVLVGAIAADAPSRPPGVSADAWAPISDTVGVVLVAQMPAAGDTGAVSDPQALGPRQAPLVGAGGAILTPPTTGYLMVKRGGTWQRLILIEPLKGPGSAG
jgi:hypothetical protein